MGAVLVAAQPVVLVAWCLPARPVEIWSLAPLEASGAVTGLFLASRLVVRRSKARFRAEMRWFGQAAVQYLVCCLTPLLLLGLILWLVLPGGREAQGLETILVVLGMVVLWVHLPTLVLLLVQAPRAERGARVGVLVGLLPIAAPTLMMLATGLWPLLLLIVGQLVFAFLVLPGYVPLPGLPALGVVEGGAGSRPDRLPVRGAGA
ncbi:hypothetical protein [Kitasatospora sp. NPDC047058]|uniref:hypothetical protein n=1 Tax=Kitasatospora sp. NPDC047058 TaxID=3155620 RepID=UPI0034008611